MKKIILSLFVAGTLSISAQDVTGFSKGNIGIMAGVNYESMTDNAGTKHNEFSIMPEAMFMTTANWGIRGGINYSSHKETTAAGLETSTSTFGFGAGARYFFTPSNRLSFFLDGGINGSFPTGMTNIGLNFNPGVNYFIHKNWAFSANFNLASFTIKSPTVGDAATTFAINPSTNLGGLNFGIMYVIK